MRHRLAPLIALVALCAVLAACGGSASAPATATTAAPTRAATTAPSVPPPTIAPSAAVSTASAVATTAAPAATPVVVAATLPATSAPTASVAPTAAVSSTAGGNTVAVDLKDYAITLSTSTVSAGMVTFNVKNSGPSAHNFNVQSNGEEKGVMTLDPGDRDIDAQSQGRFVRIPLQYSRPRSSRHERHADGEVESGSRFEVRSSKFQMQWPEFDASSTNPGH